MDKERHTKNSHTIMIADKDENILHIININVMLSSKDDEYKIVVYPALDCVYEVILDKEING